jgi:hypothetical protein
MSSENMQMDISENIVAWYGAIVATLSTLFSVYQLWRDSARIDIKLETGITFHGTTPFYKENTEYVGVSVINRGRRPIKIVSARLRLIGEKKDLFMTDSLAEHRVQVLTEENPKTTFYAEKSMIDIDKLWCILIADATDKKYRKYSRLLPTFERIFFEFRNKSKRHEG